MLPNFTIIHLLTTGSNEKRDEIFEYAAIRVRDGDVTETFGRLASIDKKLPLHVRKSVGLEPSALKPALPTADVLRKFLRFIENETLVCWDADEAAAFLEQKGLGLFRQQPLDLWQLATIVLPDAPGYGLEPLASQFEIPQPESKRAMPTAQLILELWERLCEQAEGMSLAVVSEITRILDTLGHPLAGFFTALERRVIAKSLGTRKKVLIDCTKNFSDIIRAKKREREPRDEPLDEDAITGLFETDGVLGKTHENYERRQEQINMVHAVCQAFNTSSHLMVEAGTGTGKSMAYLVPSILWSQQNDTPVIISTNTKNLQEQLFAKDTPYLQQHLGQDFEPALIKGRGNYLCVRKFLYTVRSVSKSFLKTNACPSCPSSRGSI